MRLPFGWLPRLSSLQVAQPLLLMIEQLLKIGGSKATQRTVLLDSSKNSQRPGSRGYPQIHRKPAAESCLKIPVIPNYL